MANTFTHNPEADELGAHHMLASLDTYASPQVVDPDVGPTTIKCIQTLVGAGSDIVSIWDSVAVTAGSDAPDFQFPTSTTSTVWLFLEGGELLVGLTLACTNVGGTAISGAPTGANTIHIVTEPG